MDKLQPFSRLSLHIGARIKARRVGDGQLSAAIAKSLEISQGDLDLFEAGIRSFTADQLYTLCGLLRVPPSWFFEDYSEAIDAMPRQTPDERLRSGS